MKLNKLNKKSKELLVYRDKINALLLNDIFLYKLQSLKYIYYKTSKFNMGKFSNLLKVIICWRSKRLGNLEGIFSFFKKFFIGGE